MTGFEFLKQYRELYEEEIELAQIKHNAFDVFDSCATEDLETCKTIIEFATGKRLKSLRWKEGQKVIHNLPGKRGIRMDFVAEKYSLTRTEQMPKK